MFGLQLCWLFTLAFIAYLGYFERERGQRMQGMESYATLLVDTPPDTAAPTLTAYS